MSKKLHIAYDLFDLLYPVGSIYMSIERNSDTVDVVGKAGCPIAELGGTWEQIQNVFLLSAGQTYSAGTTGGEATHKLTINEMPSHDGHLDAHAGSSRGKGNANKRYLDSIHSGGSTSYGWDYNDNEYYPYNISRGGNQAHNNMPPYLAVYMWKRTA